MDAPEAIREIHKHLAEVFGADCVESQWRSDAHAGDWLKFRNIYAPRPDIAVKPFNTEVSRNTLEIDSAYDAKAAFFGRLRVQDPLSNKNPRCLIAFEIENSNKGKHMLGNLVNASILGKVGIVVALREEFHRDAERVKKYLDGARERGKTKLRVPNVVILMYEELREVIESALWDRSTSQKG